MALTVSAKLLGSSCPHRVSKNGDSYQRVFWPSLIFSCSREFDGPYVPVTLRTAEDTNNRSSMNSALHLCLRRFHRARLTMFPVVIWTRPAMRVFGP